MMPWIAVEFKDKDRKKKLSSKYGVTGIPTLVIVNDNGDTISTNGRGDVAGNGANAF